MQVSAGPSPAPIPTCWRVLAIDRPDELNPVDRRSGGGRKNLPPTRDDTAARLRPAVERTDDRTGAGCQARPGRDAGRSAALRPRGSGRERERGRGARRGRGELVSLARRGPEHRAFAHRPGWVADALALHGPARQRLFGLASFEETEELPAMVEPLRPSVRALIEAAGPYPAYLYGRRGDILAWNDSTEAVYRCHLVPPIRRNTY